MCVKFKIKDKNVTEHQMWIMGLIFLVVLSIGDMTSTYYAINNGSFEGNPLPRYVITHYGWIIACLSKVLQIGLICWLLSLCHKKSQVAALAALWTIVGMSFMTVAGNVAVIYNYWL